MAENAEPPVVDEAPATAAEGWRALPRLCDPCRHRVQRASMVPLFACRGLGCCIKVHGLSQAHSNPEWEVQ